MLNNPFLIMEINVFIGQSSAKLHYFGTNFFLECVVSEVNNSENMPQSSLGIFCTEMFVRLFNCLGRLQYCNKCVQKKEETFIQNFQSKVIGELLYASDFNFLQCRPSLVEMWIEEKRHKILYIMQVNMEEVASVWNAIGGLRGITILLTMQRIPHMEQQSSISLK